ncbi:MAG: IPTL-CTERM sorting domain-containing protein [Candidatus Zixiibacteriota bacterium]|nr:MAG: IPTL-CTERM sorting domain-containing protein [candidate division Zixibacteria bacterium]
MKKLMLVLTAAAFVIGLMASPLSAQQWPNHKMHFPQLPDLIGWDVNATSNSQPPIQGITLADDWECTKTGPVEDIHFWGSWKDQDGVPATDDFESPMPMFTIGIWSNDPGPPSRPATLLWNWEGEIRGEPSEPPTLEGWYDPTQPVPNDVIYNDHVPYWRYDFILPAGTTPFVQDSGSIYWLSITANLRDPVNFQWGWKNSRDHFMDDAVWQDPTGMWQEMYEPPRYNVFHGYFDSEGRVWEGSMSTNFYGDGWYRYPSGWWNIWFYNNPYTREHSKEITLYIDVERLGNSPRITFALNYTTDLWSLEGVPGRPPLPTDFPDPPPVPEEQYIVRDTIDVIIGIDTTVSITIPAYNPEWVSIDVIATDVTVDGWIEHECVQTSLDLAFVITSQEEEDIPTLNEWGMLILALLLLAAGTIAVVRRRKRVPVEN